MHLPSSITYLLGSPGSNNKQITNLHLAQVNSASHPQRGKNWYMQLAKLIGAMKSYKHLKWQDTNLHSISVSLHNKIALHYLHNIHFPLFYWHQFDSWRLIRWTSQEPCGLLQSKSQQNHTLEMWANAQRDGRPAEYRWRPLFNAAVWLTPTTRVPCSNAAKTRNQLKVPGVP